MKTISRILIFAMLHLCWLTSYGYAEMIPTESANQSQTDRQRLLDLLDRQEVMNELEKYGITKLEAVTRINSLTDEEVTQIAGKLDELPAGAGIGKDILLIFLLPFTFVVGVAGSALIIGVSLILLTPPNAEEAEMLFGGVWKPFILNIESIGEQEENNIEEDCDTAKQSCD